MRVDLRTGLADGDHVVQLYDGHEALAQTVVGYLAEGLLAGDAVMLVATPAHLQRFRDGLVAEGVDVDRAESEGRMIALEAATALAELMVDDELDRSRFESMIVPPLSAAGRSGRLVRVYGEMVALLWARGEVLRAIELEELWNELTDRVRFTLLCGYPTETLTDPESSAHFERMCRAHSHVVGGAPVPASYEAARRFAGSPADVRRARRFVQELVSDWAPSPVVDDCLLLVSELAANAVRHAGSDFTVSLDRVEDGVQIAVGDTARRLPQVRPANVGAPGGRGLLLIDCIATRWGHHLTEGGKLVWAHVRTGSDVGT